MFTESPMCSLKHEDRAHPYKSGWRKKKYRKKWAGRAAETVCARVCTQPARGMTLTPFQRKVIAWTINLKHLEFASFVFINSFLQEVQQLLENFEIIIYLCGPAAVHG